MNFASFIDQCRSNLPVQDAVLCFTTQEQQLLFMGALLTKIRERTVVQVIDLEQIEYSTFASLIQTSFLGQSNLYWVNNLDSFSDKKKQQLLGLIRTYSGPHLLWIQASETIELQHGDSIAVPEVVDKALFIALMNLFFPDSYTADVVQSMVSQWFSKNIRLTLDQAYLLLSYCRPIAGVREQFTAQWLERIIQPEQSLFILSQHLFAKNASLFFVQWQKLKDTYNEAFWMSYWSEQLWRAYQVIDLYEAKQFAQAKVVGTRLPFSFLNNDWRKHSKESLRHAHAMIYALDNQMKNGGEGVLFDLVFARFF